MSEESSGPNRIDDTPIRVPRSTSGVMCHATTLIASTTDGTAAIPSSVYGPMYFGQRFSGIYFMYGHVKRFTVKRHPR